MSVPSSAKGVQVHWVALLIRIAGCSYGVSLPLAGAVLVAVMGRLPRRSLPVRHPPQWLASFVRRRTEPRNPGTAGAWRSDPRVSGASCCQGQWRELLTVSGRRPPHVRAHQLAHRPPGRQPGGTPGAAGLVGGVPGYGVGRLAACACPSGMARAGSVPTSYPDPARDVMICRLGATRHINSPGTRRRRVRDEACRGRGPESPPSPYGDARTSGDTAWPCKSTSGVSASGVSRPESCIPCCLMTW